MTQRVRAKMLCTTKILVGDGDTRVNMIAVYSNDPGSENKAFSDATPAADFQLHISKGKPAAEMFESGREYYVDISSCEAAGSVDIPV